MSLSRNQQSRERDVFRHVLTVKANCSWTFNNRNYTLQWKYIYRRVLLINITMKCAVHVVYNKKHTYKYQKKKLPLLVYAP